jgi:hypothetical protein
MCSVHVDLWASRQMTNESDKDAVDFGDYLSDDALKYVVFSSSPT